MQVSAPAKVNLSLKIIDRREDGFHEIETLIAPIALADQLTIDRTETGGISFECSDPSLSGPENLVVRTADRFFQRTGIRPNVRINLAKHVPHGAGLGGGSSDAAATLLALNELSDANLTRAELMQIGAEIGSDIPFFLAESAANCSGRGEVVTPRKLSAPIRLLLAKPQFGVPTQNAYRRWSGSRELPGVDYTPQEFNGVTFVNDLERPVFENYPFLARAKMWLREQPEVGAALLSGSGSTVFAALRDDHDASSLAERMRAALDPKLWTIATETIG